jgi:TusE/DsrC/DsvC family sulfur relay protein
VSENEEQEVQSPNIRIIAGVEVLFDGEGFFMNPSHWSEEAFNFLAMEAGVEDLNEKQRMVIHFIRKFYLEQGKSPLNHHIKVGTNLSLAEIEALFPGGIKYGARRLAGLPNPKGCRRGVPWNIKTN